MKTILYILLASSLILINQPEVYAQDENTDILIQEDTVQLEEQEEEKESLAEKITKTEDIQQQPISFLTILGAILIPSIFLILCYMIFKFLNF